MHETGGAAFFTAHLPEGLGDLERMRAATAAAIEGTGDNELAFFAWCPTRTLRWWWRSTCL